MASKLIEGDPLEDRSMRRLKNDGRSGVCIERFLPTSCAQAPLIAVAEAREPISRHRRRQIVALLLAEGEELVGHPSADDMNARIFRSGVAASIAIEASEWVG